MLVTEQNEPFLSREHNPIRELLDHLGRGEAPPLSWVVRWSESGEDPALAAWRAQRYGTPMVDLLYFLGLPMRELSSLGLTHSRGLAPPAWADELRRHVPVPPTLASILAKVRRDG